MAAYFMKFSSVLKNFRVLNLFIVALSQILIYYVCFGGLISSGRAILQDSVFYVFIGITVLLALCAYLINDYFDVYTDDVNQKKKLSTKDRKTLLLSYWILSITGFFLSLWVATRTNNLGLLWIYPFVSILLYYYSKSLKGKAFWGNLVVALACALVPGMLLVAEWPNLQFIKENYPFELSLFAFYLIFAFLSTLYRELIKDMEDMKGDLAENHTTLPISIGLENSKYIAVLESVMLSILIVVWLIYFDPSMFGKLTLGLILFMNLYSIIKLKSAWSPSDFHRISFLIKIMMLIGLIYLLFVKHFYA